MYSDFIRRVVRIHLWDLSLETVVNLAKFVTFKYNMRNFRSFLINYVLKTFTTIL